MEITQKVQFSVLLNLLIFQTSSGINCTLSLLIGETYFLEPIQYILKNDVFSEVDNTERVGHRVADWDDQVKKGVEDLMVSILSQ